MASKTMTGLPESLVTFAILVEIGARSLEVVEGGITIPQWRALSAIDESGGLDLGSIARAVDTSVSNASRMVDRLVMADMVEREVDVTNRRRIVVKMSKNGRKTINAVLDRRERDIRDVLKKMPEEDRIALSIGLAEFNNAASDLVMHWRSPDSE